MLFYKLKMGNYLRSTIVLGMDVVVSVMASTLLLIFCHVIDRGPGLSYSFIATWLCCSVVASAIAFYLSRFYRTIIRYSTLLELGKLCVAIFAKEVLLGIAAMLIRGDRLPLRTGLVMLSMDFLFTMSCMLLVRVAMLTVWQMINRRMREASYVNRVLVYGTGDKSVSVVTRLKNSSHYDVAGFLVPDNGNDIDALLLGQRIYRFSDPADIASLAERLGINGVLFACENEARDERGRLMEYCRKADLKLFIAPTINEMSHGQLLTHSDIRKIKIEDLLGRSEIKISMDAICERFRDKTVLVTGAAGSIGSELCRQLAGLGIRKLVMFDNAETPLHNIRLEFEDDRPDVDFTPVIGDVRLPERLDFVFRKFHPQIVFHAAAYKHVPLMEENPCEAVMVNVIGSRNVADKCIEYGVESMVMVSTDKAVNPTNIMGCTKRLAEIYVQALGVAVEQGRVKGQTRFITTRFGNVLGSNGSVIPRFAEQIERGGPITVTDPEICRYFMTIPEACRLVMEAATIADGTQIFAFDMGTPIKIADLARQMIHLAGYEEGVDIKIEYTGLRPGEKLYEEVLATKENTVPTENDRIFKAKVREYSYETINDIASRLETLSREVDIPDMVILMKETVPEFKSKHSEFEKFDKPSD